MIPLKFLKKALCQSTLILSICVANVEKFSDWLEEGIGVPVVGRTSSQSKSNVFSSEPLVQRSFMNYVGTIRIGTPKEGENTQEFRLLFDSGSSDLIIIDLNAKKSCTVQWGKQQCERVNPNRFDTSKSSTYVMTEGTFSTEFLDDSGFRGHVARDFIELGEGETKLRVIATLGVADHVANEFSPNDGTFGLGLRSISSFKPSMNTLTAIECIFAQTNVSPQIAYYIERNDRLNINGHYYGEIYFGGYNPQYVASEFMGPVSTTNKPGVHDSWFLDLISIKVGETLIDVAGQDLDGDKKLGTMATPDTGNTFTNINENIYDLIMSYVFPNMDHSKFTEGTRFLCNELPDDLPDVEFIFNNDVSLKFGPEIYIRSQGYVLSCSMLWEAHSESIVLFGNDVMQKYYTVFDYKKKEIKFALAKQEELSQARQQPGKYGKLRVSKIPKDEFDIFHENYKKKAPVSTPALAEDIKHIFI